MATAQPDICTICLEQPKTPTSLPTCTHTFCRQCLNSYVKRHEAEETVKCPTCTIACPIQDIPREDPQTEEPGPLARKEMCTFCSYKGTESEAESFCEGCDDAFLCLDCAASHGKKPRFRGHTLKPLSAYIKLARCQRHPGRNLKFVCGSCDKPACEICAVVEHDDHELVNILELKQELSHTIEPLNNRSRQVCSFQKELQERRTAEEKVITMIQNHADSIKKKIRKEIDRKKDRLISEIRAKTAGKQLNEDTSNLTRKLNTTLELSREVFDRDVNNMQQVSSLRSIKDTMKKTSREAQIKMVDFERHLLAPSTPRFLPVYDASIGRLEYLPRAKMVPVRLELGNTFTRQPCCGIYNAIPFQRLHKRSSIMVPQFACIETRGDRTRCPFLVITDTDKRLTLGHKEEEQQVFFGTVDAIVNNRSLLLLNSNHYFMSVDLYDKLCKRIDLSHVGLSCPASFTQVGDGRIAILHKRYSSGRWWLVLSILTNTFEVWMNNIELNMPMEDSVKIYSPESLDLLLIHNQNNYKVITISQDVKRSQELQRDGSVGGLDYHFTQKIALASPVSGYYILHISCDRGKVYLCIKEGKPPAPSKPPEPGLIQFYQASLVRDKWHFTAIPLEDPSGKPFCELKQDETLHFGVHQGTVMCLVVRPIPLAELKEKESKEPGMYLTRYHGKLP